MRGLSIGSSDRIADTSFPGWCGIGLFEDVGLANDSREKEVVPGHRTSLRSTRRIS